MTVERLEGREREGGDGDGGSEHVAGDLHRESMIVDCYWEGERHDRIRQDKKTSPPCTMEGVRSEDCYTRRKGNRMAAEQCTPSTPSSPLGWG